MNEVELIRRAQAGDRQSCAELFRRHAEQAVRTAYAVTRDWETAEDAVQEAFLRAFAALPSFRTDQPFRPWLYRIVVREALRLARRRQRLVPVAQLPRETEMPSVESEALENLRRRQIRAAVYALEERLRIPIILRYFVGLTEAEVAQVLGLRLSTVKSRLHEARRAIERQVGPEMRDVPWQTGSGN
ncbi:MAG: sigma-70 family RNA polymerase sigma factor [Firmicutes bacterium]|nr:sigma-70 family RNA polymerase sigma factor [Bacillota bacterium]